MEEWLVRFGGADESQTARIVGVFRKVRQLRQRPAHALDENVFDQKYIKEQRSLMVEVYEAMNLLQEVLVRHPAVNGRRIDVPSWLLKGRIWTM